MTYDIYKTLRKVMMIPCFTAIAVIAVGCSSTQTVQNQKTLYQYQEPTTLLEIIDTPNQLLNEATSQVNSITTIEQNTKNNLQKQKTQPINDVTNSINQTKNNYKNLINNVSSIFGN